MKHIVVTGGAKGIGRAIVEELAKDNYEITATYNSNKEAAKVLSEQFPNVNFIQVNLENRKQLDTFIANLNNGPAIDVLINNAGVYVGKPFEKMNEEELYQQVDLNFGSAARLIHGLLPNIFAATSPIVINISSQAVNERISGEAMYTAVKAAISNLSQVLRAELNPKGVRVVTIEPFAVNTYGLPEPSNMLQPNEIATIIQYVINTPAHIQFDTIGVSHIKQPRPDYPN